MNDISYSIPNYVKKIFILLCIFIIMMNLLLESCIKIVGSLPQWGLLGVIIFIIWFIYQAIYQLFNY